MSKPVPGIYEYLEKAIEQTTGYSPMCWRCSEVHFTMGQDIRCNLVFEGWKDAKAFAAGAMPSAEKVYVSFNHCEQMASYPAVFRELMGRVIDDPKFLNADYKTITVK